MRNIGTQTGLVKLPLALALSACAAGAGGGTDRSLAAPVEATGPAMRDTGAWTFAFRKTEIETPEGCRIAENVDLPDGSILCRMRRDDGSSLYVRLDEWKWHQLVRQPGADFDRLAGIAFFLLDQDFQVFLEKSMEGHRAKRASAEAVPSGRLPAGMAACKAYSMESTFIAGDGNASSKEQGLFCAHSRDDGIWTMVASVAEVAVVPLGQRHASNFDDYAARILSTYRMR